MYSAPMRRAGSPLQFSSGPSTANFTPAICISSREVVDDLLVAIVERAGATDPEQHFGVGRLRDVRDLERFLLGSSLHPLERGLGRLTPRVAGRLHVLQRALHLAREPGLAHHEVPAHVHDRVDVLDVHRTRLHARATCRAVPDDLVLDDLRDSGRAASATAAWKLLTVALRFQRAWGPCSKSWSRRSMISNFGESGLPVFHAGHCD